MICVKSKTNMKRVEIQPLLGRNTSFSNKIKKPRFRAAFLFYLIYGFVICTVVNPSIIRFPVDGTVGPVNLDVKVDMG